MQLNINFQLFFKLPWTCHGHTWTCHADSCVPWGGETSYDSHVHGMCSCRSCVGCYGDMFTSHGHDGLLHACHVYMCLASPYALDASHLSRLRMCVCVCACICVCAYVWVCVLYAVPTLCLETEHVEFPVWNAKESCNTRLFGIPWQSLWSHVKSLKHYAVSECGTTAGRKRCSFSLIHNQTTWWGVVRWWVVSI